MCNANISFKTVKFDFQQKVGVNWKVRSFVTMQCSKYRSKIFSFFKENSKKNIDTKLGLYKMLS